MHFASKDPFLCIPIVKLFDAFFNKALPNVTQKK